MISDVARTLLFITGYLVVLLSLIPLIRKDNWIFRAFEYPRAQKLLLNALLLVACIPLLSWNNTHDFIFAGLLSANLLYLVYQVFPYTVLARKQMQAQEQDGTGPHFRLLICNVYQYNRDFSACMARIEAQDPDLVLLVETDDRWERNLRSLHQRYPYSVLKPLNNTYGMLLFSRFALIDPRIKYLVEPDVPSIHTGVRLPSGDEFRLYCLHPQPPVPRENPRSTERDAELLLVARAVKGSKVPVVVAGDLNDVAWSYTTELFMKVSGLLDPRRGRGFFNTFHAGHWFLRWPLDHVFCSSHFLLRDLQRLPAMGSDHFPILVDLGFAGPEDRQTGRQRALEADADDRQRATEKIEKVR